MLKNTFTICHRGPCCIFILLRLGQEKVKHTKISKYTLINCWKNSKDCVRVQYQDLHFQRLSSKRVPTILSSFTAPFTHEINHKWNVCLRLKTLVCPYMTFFFHEILIFLLASNGILGYGRYYCHSCFVRKKLEKSHNPLQSVMRGGTKEREGLWVHDCSYVTGAV